MTNNSSMFVNEPPKQKIIANVIIVQVLVPLFLCINLMLITTFFMKDFFYTTMRYILFAVTLVSDSLNLILTNFTLLLAYFNFTIQVWSCLLLFTVLSLHTFITPVTLTAMTLERYVAICMPLRHAELCTTHSSLHCILVIHVVSFVPCIVILSNFFPVVTLSYYRQYKICDMEVIAFQSWQRHLRSAISQLYFLIMFIAIVFSYVKIMKVAKAASGENKTITTKGVRTVILHAFQLLLCLIQLWCPFIEAAVLKIDFRLFINIKYINYLMFALIPRCLSPLIYGLRDDKFFLALKYCVLFAFQKYKS